MKLKNKKIQRQLNFLIDREFESRMNFFVILVASALVLYVLLIVAIINTGSQKIAAGEINLLQFSTILLGIAFALGIFAIAHLNKMLKDIVEHNNRLKKGLSVKKNPWTGEFINE